MMSSSKKQSASKRYMITAGALVRGSLKDLIHKAAFATDVNLDVTEDKRWLSSRFHIRASGAAEQVAAFDNWMVRFMRENS